MIWKCLHSYYYFSTRVLFCLILTASSICLNYLFLSLCFQPPFVTLFYIYLLERAGKRFVWGSITGLALFFPSHFGVFYFLHFLFESSLCFLSFIGLFYIFVAIAILFWFGCYTFYSSRDCPGTTQCLLIFLSFRILILFLFLDSYLEKGL